MVMNAPKTINWEGLTWTLKDSASGDFHCNGCDADLSGEFAYYVAPGDHEAFWCADCVDTAVDHRGGESSTWEQEFDASYAIPAEVLALVAAGEVKDLSWHNDSCPSFGVFDEDTEREVRLWVEHPDPARRDNEGPRFNVNVAVHHSSEGDAIRTDDVAEAVRVLREQLVIFRRGEFSNVRSVPCDECRKVTPTLCTYENAQVCPGCFDGLSKKHGYAD